MILPSDDLHYGCQCKWNTSAINIVGTCRKYVNHYLDGIDTSVVDTMIFLSIEDLMNIAHFCVLSILAALLRVGGGVV